MSASASASKAGGTTGGTASASSSAPAAGAVTQLRYADPATGITLAYNLYVPAGYDTSKTYPLVLFMEDASLVAKDVTTPLGQVGANAWTTDEAQARNPAFVLVPEYAQVIANDSSETAADADATVNLIKSLEGQYAIDTNRIYTTGQSMGAMTSIALMIKYPDVFAAALVVSGQWDAAKMAILTKANMWIVVTDGDSKAYPGGTASVAALEAAGATVTKATWSIDDGAAAVEAAAEGQAKGASNLLFTVWHSSEPSLNNHMGSFAVTYSIAALRDWLFSQTRVG